MTSFLRYPAISDFLAALAARRRYPLILPATYERALGYGRILKTNPTPFYSPTIIRMLKSHAQTHDLISTARLARHLSDITNLIVYFLSLGPHPLSWEQKKRREEGFPGEDSGYYCQICELSFGEDRGAFVEHWTTVTHLNKTEEAAREGRVDWPWADINRVVEPLKKRNEAAKKVLNMDRRVYDLVEECVAWMREMGVVPGVCASKEGAEEMGCSNYPSGPKWQAAEDLSVWAVEEAFPESLEAGMGLEKGMHELFDLECEFGFKMEVRDGRECMVEYRPTAGDTPLPGQEFRPARNIWTVGWKSAWAADDTRTPGLWAQLWLAPEYYTASESASGEKRNLKRKRDEEPCSICMTATEDGSGKKLVAVHGCCHEFCGDCLDEWCNQPRKKFTKITCPMCRGVIGVTPPHNIEAYKGCKNEASLPQNYWAYNEIRWWAEYFATGGRERAPGTVRGRRPHREKSPIEWRKYLKAMRAARGE